MRKKYGQVSVGQTTELFGKVADNLQPILSGCLLSIDPSVGSRSSMPGFAVYHAGELIRSGYVIINLDLDLPTRLQVLRLEVESLFSTHRPDVLVYEDIGPLRRSRFGLGANPSAYASLMKGVGSILSAGLEFRPKHVVGIKPVVWKRLARPEYKKGDEADAVEMGYIVIKIAREIRDSGRLTDATPSSQLEGNPEVGKKKVSRSRPGRIRGSRRK